MVSIRGIIPCYSRTIQVSELVEFTQIDELGNMDVDQNPRDMQ